MDYASLSRRELEAVVHARDEWIEKLGQDHTNALCDVVDERTRANRAEHLLKRAGILTAVAQGLLVLAIFAFLGFSLVVAVPANDRREEAERDHYHALAETIEVLCAPTSKGGG